MGCDIHVHCEYRSRETNMEWFNCDWYRRNPYYDKLDPEYAESKWELIPAYDYRNYTLFGILAGVRDRSNPMISAPRSVPEDIHKQTRKEYERELEWTHSHSWLTLQELIDYMDKYNNVKLSGKISPEAANDLDIFGIIPSEWCAETNIPDWVYREWECDVNHYVGGLLKCLYTRFDEAFYVYDFLSEAEKDQKRREYAKNARIVFWFDN